MDYTFVYPTSTATAVELDAVIASMPPVKNWKPRRRASRTASHTTTTGFDALAEIWERDTRNSSDMAMIAQHWAYRAIIGMGPAVIPQIIDRMREQGGYWFPALKELADWDPILPEEWGSTKKMREAWYRWEESPDAKDIRNQGSRYLFCEFSETT